MATYSYVAKDALGKVITGTSEAEKDRGYQVKGATGTMVRTLIHLAMGFAESRKT